MIHTSSLNFFLHSISLQKNINRQYPLHCVIESRCIENLKEVENLLCYHELNTNIMDTTSKIKYSPYVNVKDDNGQNCLHTLAESLTNETYEVIFPLMKILLSHGCNANFPNHDGKTAFLMVLEKLSQIKQRKEIAEYFIKNGDLDFYTHKSEEIIDLVMNQKVKYLNVLPDKDEFVVNFDNLMDLLMDGDINKFETKFSLLKGSCADMEAYKEHLSTFLEVAVAKSLINIVDLLIDFGVDINKIPKSGKSKLSPPFLAYKNSNVGILRSFLLQPEIKLYQLYDNGKIKTLLHLFFDDFKSQSYTSYKKSNFSRQLTCNQKKCFDLVIKHTKCDRDLINACDGEGLVAIYYSVRYKIDYFTMELLKHGAYIGTVVNGIRTSLLTDFLDNCIVPNDRFYDDEAYEIKLNYGFLMPSQPKVNQRKFRRLGKQDKSMPISQKTSEEFHSLVKAAEDKYAEEMKPLTRIAESAEIRRFLMHPVLSSFILLKWNKINFLIYANLLLILMYMFSFISFILLSQSLSESERDTSILYNLFFVLSLISLSLLILRESMQFVLSIKQYVQAISNWIDIGLISSSVAVLFFQWNLSEHLSRVFRTVIILLVVAEYFNLLGLLPLLSISLHTKMFKKVCMTFVKSLSFYSVMILGFAFSFYTLHGDKFAKDLEKEQKEPHDEKLIIPPLNLTRNDRYNNFYTIGLSVVKSFVMLSGELEGGYIHQEGVSYALLFLLFFFLVVIVLYNLLNALAVSDTQEIKSDAKLIDLHQRILTMQEAEQAVFKRNSKLGDWLKKVISMFPMTIPEGSIIIYPNRSRHIYIRPSEAIVLDEWIPNRFNIWKKHVKINQEIVLDIRELLAKKREERTVNAVRKLKENRNEKLANDIMRINEMISDIQANMTKLQSDVYSLKKRVNL